MDVIFMLPTFSVNTFRYSKESYPQLREILIKMNKNDDTREWAASAFLKINDGDTVANLDRFVAVCKRNTRMSQNKRNQREFSFVNQEDLDDGHVGIVESSIGSKIDMMSYVIDDVDMDYYVNDFLNIREKIFFLKGIDIWRVIELAKLNDYPALSVLRQLMDEFKFRETLEYVLTKTQCYSKLEGILC